jgi:hypothetical protein
MWAVILLPVAALGLTAAVFAWTKFDEIGEHWTAYRCNPLVMPFAALWGKDAVANCRYCVNRIGRQAMAQGANPLSYLFSAIGSVMSDLVGSIDQLRSMLAAQRAGLLGVVTDTLNKLHSTFAEVVVLLVRLKDVFHKMVASGAVQVALTSSMFSLLDSFFSLAMSFIKAMVTALFVVAVLLSFVMPELLAFAIGLGSAVGIMYCFAPDTCMVLEGGAAVRMDEVPLGAVLAGGRRVVGTMAMSGAGVPMFRLGRVVASGCHKVWEPAARQWRYVRDCADAVPVPELPRLACVITSDNRVELDGRLWTDYEEVSSDTDLLAIEALVWGVSVGEFCAPGLAGDTLVPLHNGLLRPAKRLAVGDQLRDGGVVQCVVHLEPEPEPAPWHVVAGTRVTACTWVCLPGQSAWTWAQNAGPSATSAPRDQVHLITTGGYVGLVGGLRVRDYADSHDPAVLDNIEQFVMKRLNGLCYEGDRVQHGGVRGGGDRRRPAGPV